MRKVFKKFFSHSNTDGLSEKSSKKLSSARNRVLVPNLKNQVKQTKCKIAPNDDPSNSSSSAAKVVEEGINFSHLDSRKNEPGSSTLHAAVSEGNARLVEQLLAQGTDSETVDENGLTPFLKAVRIGNVQLVNVMVQRNKFQTDANGNTALHIAVKEEFLRIAEILVNEDPLVNVPNKVGDLPLHIAVSKECFSIVELLLKNKAVMNVENSQKRTPLLIALKLENVPLIQLLLKYGAHKNDRSIISYLPAVRNPKVKTLFRFLDYTGKASISFANDDDFQNSEMLTLPPVLDSPRSWNILHPKQNSEYHSAGENITHLLPHKRSKHFNQVPGGNIGESNKNLSFSINADKKSDSLTVDGKAIEDCKKALIELSLSVSPEEKDATPNESNEARKSAETYSLCSSNSARLAEMKLWKNHECKDDQNQNYSPKDTQSLVKCSNEYSSSSDEEPLLWENSNDGGYFTEWSRSSKFSNGNEIENSSKSSSSDEDLDNFQHDKVHTAMLNSLKRVTQENKELETESAVLRESVEKLKYDLANSREDMETEKINSLSLMSHLTDFDEKYVKVVENVGTSQLYISNLEKEISHLKRTYKESCKINRFLTKELRKSVADIASVKLGKCRSCESKSFEINDLQAEISEWKNKFDDLTQHYAGSNSSNSYHQETKSNADLMNETVDDIMKQKLLLEISKLNSIIKDKEVKEEQLKNQLHELRREIYESKSEKRNMLIRKTFHDKHGFGTVKNRKDAQFNLDVNQN